jgi:hypothetical protein
MTAALLDRQYRDSMETKGWIITSVGKLIAQTGLFPHHIKDKLSLYLSSMSPEVQQRYVHFCTMHTHIHVHLHSPHFLLSFTIHSHTFPLYTHSTFSLIPSLTTSCLEVLSLAAEPQLMRAVFPLDASCEDLEVDSSLSFLNGYVQQALRNGAQPYRTKDQRAPKKAPVLEGESVGASKGVSVGVCSRDAHTSQPFQLPTQTKRRTSRRRSTLRHMTSRWRHQARW